MSISLRVEYQNHEVIHRITDHLVELGPFSTKLPESFLMAGIHPYGDTYFNMIQLRYLLAELQTLKEEYPEHDQMFHVIAEAAGEAIKARGYLKFVGD